MTRKAGHLRACLRHRAGADEVADLQVCSARSTRRALLSALWAGALSTLPLVARAQQQVSIPRIGLLWITSESPPGYLDAFREGLRLHGYVEGKNIRIEDRFLVDRYDRLAAATENLVAQRVDAILSFGTTATLAASNATSTIPIIMSIGADPVQLGVATSFSRPGRNVTGMVTVTPDLAGKRLELLKEAVPGIRHVAVVYNPESRNDVTYRQNSEAAARKLKLDLRAVEVRTADEIDNSISSIAKLGVSGIAVVGSTLYIAQSKRLVMAIEKTRLPAIYTAAAFVEAGGLMSYAANLADGFRRLAYHMDKVLKGANPGDLPIEQPTKFELVLNLKTAKAHGIKIPQSLLLRADRVIE